jgi:hypothetical protein
VAKAFLMLKNIQAGQILNVPIDHPAFDAMAEYRDRLLSKPLTKINFEVRLVQMRDYPIMRPLYYCLVCGRIEDGTHRWEMARRRGDATVPVIGASFCNKRSGLKNPVWKQECPSHQDWAWVQACDFQKWPFLESGLRFRGARVLEVGSQMGYSVMRAALFGAKEAHGIENRIDICEAAIRVRDRLGYSADMVQFQPADGREIDAREYDTVLCMGLLHYWDRQTIREMVTKMAQAEQVGLELRTHPGEAFVNCGTQTITPLPWLKGILAANGLTITTCWTHSKPEIRFDRTIITARRNG